MNRAHRTGRIGPGRARGGTPYIRSARQRSHPARRNSQAGQGPRTSATPAAAHPGGRRSGRTPRLVTRIAPDRVGAAGSGYGYHLMPAIDVSCFQQLRLQFPATVNDLLIGALILAIADWNTAHGRQARRIRITMPVSDRPAGEVVTLGNSSRLTVITAPGLTSTDDVDQLISQVAAQTWSAKQAGGSQAGYLSRLLTSAWLPVGAKRLLLRTFLRTIGPAVIGTSLVTNLGVLVDPPRFGSQPASRLAFSTSAHLPRGLSAGVITVGSQLQICLRYRRALIDDTASAQFAQCYSRALSELAGSGQPGLQSRQCGEDGAPARRLSREAVPPGSGRHGRQA